MDDELNGDAEVNLTVKEAAQRLNVSESLVRSMINRGELQARRAGRLIRIPESVIDAWESGLSGSFEVDENALSSLAASDIRPESSSKAKMVRLPNGRLVRPLGRIQDAVAPRIKSGSKVIDAE